jgi:hypothetical protein
MPLQKNDDNQALKPQDLVFILAIAGRIDAQARILAQKIDKGRHAYYAYAVLDSLSSSYSMFKYFFDIAVGGTPDEMHDLMLNPAGIIAIAVESIFMVGFSFLACHFDKEKDKYKQWIAAAWPYFRDVMKGLKNAYKGWRSALLALTLIGNVDVKFLIGPIGLILGILAAANRFLLRAIVESRKVKMTEMAKLLAKFRQSTSLTEEEHAEYLALLLDSKLNQSRRERGLAFAGSAIGGFIDGLYLYMGVLTLTALAPQLLIAMASICVFYTVTCIITRLYEEYEFQLRLFIMHTKCELVMLGKVLETSYANLRVLQEKTNPTEEELNQIKNLKKALSRLLGEFELKRQLLQKQTSRTYLSATLLGIKNGLYAYGALSSILFLVSSFLLLAGVVFPPGLVIATVLMGLVFMTGFLIHALWANHKHLKNQKDIPEDQYSQLSAIKKSIDNDHNETLSLTSIEFHQAINDGLSVNPAPQYFFQEWFEVFRSLFSGFGKGQKFVDFAGNPLQEIGSDGHYHDTPLMLIGGGLFALGFGLTLSSRALAKGLGRQPLGNSTLTSDIVIKPLFRNDEPTKKSSHLQETIPTLAQTKVPREPGETIPPSKPDSLHRNESLLSLFGIFGNKSPSPNRATPPTITDDEEDLDSPTSDRDHTIADLNLDHYTF